MRKLVTISCLIAVVFVLFVGYSAFGQAYNAGASTEYYQGYSDGMRDGTSDAGFINGLWGFLFGIFNIGYVLMTPPHECPTTRVLMLEGKSFQYKQGYLEGYKKGRQQQRLMYSIGGAVVEMVVYALSYRY